MVLHSAFLKGRLQTSSVLRNVNWVRPYRSRILIGAVFSDCSTAAELATSEIKKIMSLTGFAFSDAAALLKHFKWDAEKLTERYFEDPEKVAASAVCFTRLLDEPTLSKNPLIAALIHRACRLKTTRKIQLKVIA